MDLSVILDYFDSAPLPDAERAIRFGTRIVRDRIAQGPQRKPEPLGQARARVSSIRARAHEYLRGAGQPRTAAEIARALSESDAKVTADSVRSILSRLVKSGVTFTRLEDGRFGLLDWDHEAALDAEAVSRHRERTASAGDQSAEAAE